MLVPMTRRSTFGRALLAAALLAVLLPESFDWVTSLLQTAATTPPGKGVKVLGPNGGAGGPYRKTAKKIPVIMLKDDKYLGTAGTVVKIKRRQYRQLWPFGIVMRQDRNAQDFLRSMQDKADQEAEAQTRLLMRAVESRKLIEQQGPYYIEKKARPQEGQGKGAPKPKLYGSVTREDVAGAVVTKTGIPCPPSSVDLPDDKRVDTVGSYDFTIELHPQVTCVIKVEVVPDGGAPKPAPAE